MAAIPSSLNQFTAKWQPMLFARLRSVLDAHAQRDTIVNMTDVFGSFALDFVYLTLFDLDEDFMGRNFEEFKRVRESAEFVFDVSMCVCVYVCMCVCVCADAFN